MNIIVNNTPVETYHPIDMIEHYYRPLKQIYSIITTKILSIELELTFQMFFKAINDSVGSNKLVPTLLVFSTYPRMTKLDA